MTTFQLILIIASSAIFYTFLKQIFSGSHPKRGIDFEAKIADEQLGGISRPDKTFSRPAVSLSRIEELNSHADNAVEDGNFEEAKKALGSALIIDNKNIETLYKMAYVHIQTEEHNVAIKHLEHLLELDSSDDMAEAALANTLHKKGLDDEALSHHRKSIEIDPEYAPHYYNYANTLYDLGKLEEAKTLYENAYKLDTSLDDAKKMIEKLSE